MSEIGQAARPESSGWRSAGRDHELRVPGPRGCRCELRRPRVAVHVVRENIFLQLHPRPLHPAIQPGAHFEGVGLGLGGNQAALARPAGKGKPGSSPGEATGALFQPLGWGPAGGGEAVAVPGDPCISASKRPGFVKCLESPWKSKGTRRRAPGGRRVLGLRPPSPLGPWPCGRACREL